MPIGFSLGGTDVRLIFDIKKKISVLEEALVKKMTYLMTRLMLKAQDYAEIPVVQRSIRNPRAFVRGTAVVGYLDWGGEPSTVTYKGGKPYDLAQIFNYGAKQHAINPLNNPLTGRPERPHTKGEKRRFGGATMLRIGSDITYPGMRLPGLPARQSFHPGIIARHFMEKAIADMKNEAQEQILTAIRGSLGVKY